MRIDLIRPGAWDALCDQYRAQIATLNSAFQDPAMNVQVYLGYRHAVWEATQALAKLFANKKTIAVVANGEPVFESVAMAFSSEGYNVLSLTKDQLAQPSTWFDPVQTDLLFVLFAHDDPVTGRVHRYAELNAALKDKRVFRIGISHALHRFEKLERPGLFELRLLSLRPDRALLLAGERCKIRPPLVEQLPWKPEDESRVRSEVSPLSEIEIERLRKSVLEFEGALPAGFLARFAKGEERVWDRALIYHPSFDGSAVIDALASVGIGQIAYPGESANLEATSPCRWESPRLVDWLKANGESEETIRGLVALSSELPLASLTPKLEAVAKEITRLQEGE